MADNWGQNRRKILFCLHSISALASIIVKTKWLNPVTSNVGISHKIVQVNTLHALDDILVIEILEVEFVYPIYTRRLLSRLYGIHFRLSHIKKSSVTLKKIYFLTFFNERIFCLKHIFNCEINWIKRNSCRKFLKQVLMWLRRDRSGLHFFFE